VALGGLELSPLPPFPFSFPLICRPTLQPEICIQQHEENIDKCPPLNAINNLNYVAKPYFIANTSSHNKNSMAKQMASLLKYV